MMALWLGGDRRLAADIHCRRGVLCGPLPGRVLILAPIELIGRCGWEPLKSRAKRIILPRCGGCIVYRIGGFMTVSEANRHRVLCLLDIERQQTREQIRLVDRDKESAAVKRGKPPMSEPRQYSLSDRCDMAPPASL